MKQDDDNDDDDDDIQIIKINILTNNNRLDVTVITEWILRCVKLSCNKLVTNILPLLLPAVSFSPGSSAAHVLMVSHFG